MKIENIVVLIADGVPDSTGESCKIEAVKLPDQPVTVLLNFDISRPVGTATLRKDGNNVVADLDLLMPHDGFTIPSIGGSYTFKRDSGECGMEINQVGLCNNPNLDPRITPITDNKTGGGQ